jgi:MFS family permease
MMSPNIRRTPYFGWIQVSALAVTQLIGWGVLYYAFGVVLAPMLSELGWTTVQATGAYSLGMFVNGLTVPIAGRWLDERGPRLLMSVGSLLAAMLVYAWSQVTSLTALYVVWCAIGIVMSMVLYESAFWIAAQWFRRGRGRALTLITLGGGLASTVFIPLTSVLTIHFGWRAALQCLALILAALTVPLHALLLRRRPQDHGLLPDGDIQQHEITSIENNDPPSQTLSAVLRTADFWMLSLAFTLSTLAWNGISVHFISYEHARGLDPAAIALAAGLIGVTQVAGRTILTPLTDLFSRRKIAYGLFLLQAAAFAALLTLPDYPALVVYVLCFGIGFGVLTPVRAALVADAYGVRNYGAINGAMSVSGSLARAAAPVLAGAVIGAWGYEPVLWFCMLASLCGLIALRLVRSKNL